MNEHISKIDTERFGFKVAKINSFKNEPIKIVNKLKKEGVRLIISRINASDLNLINTLEKIGFELKDIQLSYTLNLKGKENYADMENHNFTIRDVKTEDIEQISNLAKQAFNGYGHYFADKRLDYEKCNEIYADWARNTCANISDYDKIIVAEDKGEILAFGTFKIIENEQEKYAKGIIGGVLPEYQKMGFLKIISLKSMEWAVKMDAKRFEHTVLATNYGINSTYTKFGYKLFKSEITFHYWCN